MNSNFLEIAKEACSVWWGSYSTRTTTAGKVRKTRGEFAQDNARTALTMYKSAIDNKIDSQFLQDFPRKVGYGIIGGNDGIDCGLRSVNLIYGERDVRDHIFGATLAGEEFFKAFEEWDYDIDYMVNSWLPQNIWLFTTALISKKEHNDLKTHKHSKNQKRKFIHYDECGIELTHKKVKFIDSKKMIEPSKRGSDILEMCFDFKNI